MSEQTTAIEVKAKMNLAANRIAVEGFDGLYRLAQTYEKAGMIPSGVRGATQFMICLVAGYEAGLPFSFIAKNVTCINNKPCIYGDGLVALARASGRCEYINESLRGEGDGLVAICETKRKGDTHPVVRSFSVADAKKAGLWGKTGPWTNYPNRMLQMRARSYALRDAYADVIGGMSMAEEEQDTSITVTEPACASETTNAIAALPEPETE